jgi:hypothetical protein
MLTHADVYTQSWAKSIEAARDTTNPKPDKLPDEVNKNSYTVGVLIH